MSLANFGGPMKKILKILTISSVLTLSAVSSQAAVLTAAVSPVVFLISFFGINHYEDQFYSLETNAQLGIVFLLDEERQSISVREISLENSKDLNLSSEEVDFYNDNLEEITIVLNNIVNKIDDTISKDDVLDLLEDQESIVGKDLINVTKKLLK